MRPLQAVNTFHAGKTLKEQAQILAHTHIYMLFHGAAMALYLFLPENAAIIEVSYLISISSPFLHFRS